MIYKESEPHLPATEQIAAAIAHEIRNPLALIKANLQYFELCEADPRHKKNYELIYREIDRINELLGFYMDTTRPDNLILKSFGVNELVAEVEHIFRQVCVRGGIKLTVLGAREEPEVSADYNKIKQVLINVVQNAVESIEGAGRTNGQIEIAAYKSGGYVRIEVTDNGGGISEEDIKRIGTPFFTGKERGCGLGISISKEIMRRHKGSLSIRGAKGKGAAVTISLPLYSGGA